MNLINLTFKYTCSVPRCNHTDFYCMPCDEKAPNGEDIKSNTKFLLRCKKCNQKYLLCFGIKQI